MRLATASAGPEWDPDTWGDHVWDHDESDTHGRAGKRQARPDHTQPRMASPGVARGPAGRGEGRHS